MRGWWFGAFLGLLGCVSEFPEGPALEPAEAALADAGRSDAARTDSGRADGARPDAVPKDAAPKDASPSDSALKDSAVADAQADAAPDGSVITCESLGCALRHQRCVILASGAACEGCEEGHRPSDIAGCVPIDCDYLDCGDYHKRCDDSTTPICRGCVTGYVEIGDLCIRPGCEQLGCAELFMECEENGDSYECRGCLPGYHAVNKTCEPDTCESLNCSGRHRTCEVTSVARCGSCEYGYLAPTNPEEDDCVPWRCSDLHCESRFQSCQPGEPYDQCSGCLDGYVPAEANTCRPVTCDEIRARCQEAGQGCDDGQSPAVCAGCLAHFVPDGAGCRGERCADLGCEASLRACVAGERYDVCGDCLTGAIQEGEGCRAPTCEELGCQAQGKVCDLGQRRCGGCLLNYVVSGDVCRPQTCDDLQCGQQNRECPGEPPVSACGQCRSGYVERRSRCVESGCRVIAAPPGLPSLLELLVAAIPLGLCFTGLMALGWRPARKRRE